MRVDQTHSQISPRAIAPPQPNNRRIALTTQQVSQIAQIFDPIVEDELAKVRRAWEKYQATRQRDAIYPYLNAVFEIVGRWKKQHRANASSRQALNLTKQFDAMRIDEPFSIVIFCTSDACKVDTKTRSKWARALRYAERFKPDTQDLVDFIKSKGGINECADQFSSRLR